MTKPKAKETVRKIELNASDVIRRVLTRIEDSSHWLRDDRENDETETKARIASLKKTVTDVQAMLTQEDSPYVQEIRVQERTIIVLQELVRLAEVFGRDANPYVQEAKSLVANWRGGPFSRFKTLTTYR